MSAAKIALTGYWPRVVVHMVNFSSRSDRIVNEKIKEISDLVGLSIHVYDQEDFNRL